MIDERDIERVLARANIVDVIESCGISLKKRSGHYECCCPFHQEKTPSFMVDIRKQTWFCYGACQEGGNAIRFLMRFKGLSYPEAIKELAAQYNIDLHSCIRLQNSFTARHVTSAKSAPKLMLLYRMHARSTTPKTAPVATLTNNFFIGLLSFHSPRSLLHSPARFRAR